MFRRLNISGKFALSKKAGFRCWIVTIRMLPMDEPARKQPLHFYGSKHHDKPARSTALVVVIVLLAVAIFASVVWFVGYGG